MLKILTLLIVMASLPFLLSDRPFVAPALPPAAATTATVSQTPALPGTADHWLEFFRTLLGAFAGAGAAFYANVKLQERARRREEIASGNYAMATLVRQYNSFLNVQRTVREEVARRDSVAPGVPLWFVFRPIIHFLDENLTFDFESLAFIFEDGNIGVFQQLHQAEGMHRDLMGYVRRLSENSIRKQEKFEAAGFAEEGSEMTARQARTLVGPRLSLELESVIEQIQMHCTEDGPKYLSAAADLHGALSRRFGPGVRLIRLVGPA